ncbi:hypothetical protein HMI49_09985 [Corallococcus exercitus]|uniref:Uncharacterized protein n=1 Tax=Corallococcus exercitus TaxID=2316736 RepID=A0A7Y4KGU6_9BACT|nr:hypothetical protein [Corallococcus exercitus]NOK33527.1 hypothetical protein [Corallococcus exercitus]
MGMTRGVMGWRLLWSVMAVVALGGCGPAEAPEASPRTEEAGLAGGDFVWVKHLGSPRSDQAHAVAFDRDGNILALFLYQGCVDLGAGPVGSGNPDSYGFAVAKYTTAGALLWTRSFEGVLPPGGQNFVNAVALTVDRERNVLIAGASNQSIDLGGGLQPAGAFLLKLRKTGQFQWARHFTGNISPRDLVTDSQDAIAMTGAAFRTVDFGQGPNSSQVTDVQTAFLTKFNAAGTAQWTVREQWDLSGGASVAVDEADAFYFSGIRYPDPEVWKVGPTGAVAWTRPLVGAAGGAMGIAVHGNRVVAGGQFSDTFTFAGQAVPNPFQGSGGFLVAWTRAGEERWAHGYPQPVSAVAMAEDDSVVVGGASNEPDTSAGYTLFTARLERLQGQQHWLRTYSSTGRPYFTDMAVNKHGEFVGIGYFSGTLHLNADYVSRGLEDDFLFKGLTGP